MILTLTRIFHEACAMHRNSKRPRSTVDSDTFDVHDHANLGSVEVTLFVSLVLFGVLVHQIYTYYKSYNDRMFLKVPYYELI
ncbi:hypothetical protein D9615_009650 [Tricholomella constricta]|uniref:Uncharacterized protein n=1 Tax=Tricholomella constricta TaxID=117010 RepID=A0A8H5GUK1_9AGAR|nr:hypothetical protein D9615_009650 [Tricholomella constricta]